MNADFWSGKRVFLTGHSGFKGSWLALWLQQMGAQVRGFALEPPTSPSLFAEARIAQGMESHTGDIRDYRQLSESLASFRPEIVIHMAAQSLVRPSYDLPVETYATNVMGTVHLLEAVRQSGGVRAVVNVTSDKCYENREWLWGYRENEPMGGFDPYSNSKGCAELATSAYRCSFFNPQHYHEHGCALATVRAGNVIGGGDWARDRLVPDILRAFEAGAKVEIRSPGAVRPWQHVLEPLSGYLQLAERLYVDGAEYAEGWNFGPDEQDARPVGWIVRRMVELWGGDAGWSENREPQPHEANYLKLDCSKAKTLLEWRPRWHLQESLQRIVRWHKAWLSGDDMREASLAEIMDYRRAGAP
jgi:CDP-glucose 4,6-dehydratase